MHHGRRRNAVLYLVVAIRRAAELYPPWMQAESCISKTPTLSVAFIYEGLGMAGSHREPALA